MKTPETAFINGKVYTVDNNFSVATAFAVAGDRFVCVGTDDEVRAVCGPETKIVDLQGRTVVPGLTDAHLHLTKTGKMRIQINCAGKQKAEILEMVKEAYEKAAPGQWIEGRCWVNDEWKDDKNFPTKEELDAVSPDVPVALFRACGHMTWVNSKAFELAGIDENTPDPYGGEYLKKEDGSLWGVVTDQAQEPINKAMPLDSVEVLSAATLAAQDGFFEAGLTTVHDAGADPRTIDVWKKLYEEGSLKLRINASLRVPGRPWYDEIYKESMEYIKRGIEYGLYGNRLNVRGYKISGDGSLGARSAWMFEDYSDRPGHKGNGKWSDEELYSIFAPYHQMGFQLWYHAIGDAANRQALDMFERLQKEYPRQDCRHRIEHAQILKEEDVPRFKELGVIPTFQTVFLRTDKRCCDDRIGDRVKYAYAWRTMIDQGNPIPNGTDSPVESFNPFLGFYCAVSRKDEEGFPEGGWYKEQAMTREEALKSYTVWPAYTEFMENLKGQIAPSFLADFVVLDNDIMTCPEGDILKIKALATYLGGECVFERK